jgi:dTMP kinase
MKKKGLFITFEGLEGCGKSTQVEKLYHLFKKRNIPVVITKEPGGTQIGERIRKILLDKKNNGMDYKAEMLLFLASRSENVRLNIIPALHEGKIVISDRFIDSTAAYQGYGRGIDIDTIQRLNQLVIGEANPDLTFILDIEPEIGLKRSASFSDDSEMRFEEEFLDKKIICGKLFLDRVKEGYRIIAENNLERIKVINANRSKDDIFKDIIKIIDENILTKL